MEETIKKREAVINKVKRFPIVVFLKRSIPFLVLILIILLSFLFGLWNVREFDYRNSQLNNVKSEKLDLYLSEYLGKNIFILSLPEIENKLIESDGYIKDVYIKKILPWKLGLLIEEYKGAYLGYSSNRCILFADNGKTISEICKECEKECLEKKSSDVLYITSDSSLESNGYLLFFEEISKIQKVLSEFKYVATQVNITKGIATITDIGGHTFVFDITYDFDIQLARVYIVCQKINEDIIKFKSLDLRFDRPVMRLE